MYIDVRVQGVDQIELALKRASNRAMHLRPGLDKIRKDMFRVLRATFTGQGRRYGGSWQALKPETLQRKIDAGLDPRILIARRRLMDSFTRRESRYMRTRITNSRIELSSILPYADTQQYGDEGRGIPARPFIDFHVRDHERWANILLREMAGAFHGH